MTELETLCNDYRENKRLIEELDAMNDGLKSQIIELMDGRESVTAGSCKATYKTVTSSKLDTTGLKKDYPEIVSQYTKTTTYKRFNIA